MDKSQLIKAPALDGDDQREIALWTRNEREILANLIAHLNRHGFIVEKVYDGGEDVHCLDDMKAALEAIFAVDESAIWFRGASGPKRYCVTVILGNGNDGLDVISDHSVPAATSDGKPHPFTAAMDEFGNAIDQFTYQGWGLQ